MNAVVTVDEKPAKTAYERLPRRYRRFVDHYVQGKTGSESLRLAGSKSTQPNTIAARLVKRPDVAAAIEEREALYIADMGVRAARIMRETLAIATLDPRKVEDENGDPIPLHKLDPDTAAAIAAVEVENISVNGETGRRYKYKFWDKNKALQTLGQSKALKLWEAGTKNVTNVDARSVTNVVAAGPEALSGAIRLLEQARTIAVVAAAADGNQNGSVLPAAVRDEPQGRGASVDAGEDT